MNTGENNVCSMFCKVITKKWALIKHVMLHKDVKPFYCGMCKNLFSSQAKLRRHVKTHPEHVIVKLFMCDICEKGFKNSQYLSSHVKIHYNAVSSKKYQCNKCENVYTRSSSLKRHMPVHLQSNTCTGCGKGFKLPDNLLNHIKHCCVSKLKIG